MEKILQYKSIINTAVKEALEILGNHVHDSIKLEQKFNDMLYSLSSIAILWGKKQREFNEYLDSLRGLYSTAMSLDIRMQPYTLKMIFSQINSFTINLDPRRKLKLQFDYDMLQSKFTALIERN